MENTIIKIQGPRDTDTFTRVEIAPQYTVTFNLSTGETHQFTLDSNPTRADMVKLFRERVAPQYPDRRLELI